MIPSTVQFESYRVVLARCNRRAWLGALIGAVCLNLAMFMAMPHLLDTTPSKPMHDTLVPQIQVIRLKRPETPVARPPVQPPPVEQSRRPEPIMTEKALRQPVWPFEINPRLPGGPATLALPPIDTQLGASAGIPDLFGVADLDQSLISLVRMAPVYPLPAKRKGTEGWVTVRFIVNEHGTVEKITISEAQSPGIFDDSVIRCVSGWRFQPGTVQGRPVKVWAETTIHFELD